jgi:phage/plasmid primase-like uncharacterized protein
MAYKTYNDQINEHLNTLKANGLEVSELKVDSSSWTRCYAIGDSTGRGEFSYITNTEKLSNGLLGIRTSFRGPNGLGSFKTYGLSPNENEEKISVCSNGEYKANVELQEQAARKAYGFWNHSSIQGRSDYLDRKGVGHYGIRFRSSEQYGNVAVVPMFDDDGRLWSYQLLNPDGTKRHPKDCRTEGLFHKLKEPTNGKPIGIAESYVTSATCFELSGIPLVCAFTSENLIAVAQAIRLLFPASPIILFADNDKHLEEKGIQNKGVLKARQAINSIKHSAILASPDFGNLSPSKEATDWNDLVRLKGRDIAKAQMQEILTCQSTCL